MQDTVKLDILWKKVAFGVTETSPTGKDATNESIASPLPVYSDTVWADSALIPRPAAASSVTQAISIPLTADPTVTGNKTWLTGMGDFIPPSIHPTYIVQIYNGSTPLNAIANDYYFDYQSGVLHFAGAVPSITTLTLTGWRYIGRKGVGNDIPDDVVDAIKDLIPPPPPQLSDMDFSFIGGVNDLDGSRILVASGAGAVPAQTPITQFSQAAEIRTTVLSDFAKESGSLSIIVNGADAGTIVLDREAPLPVTDGRVTQTGRNRYPETLPFHRVISVQGNCPTDEGIYGIQFQHTETGNTPIRHYVSQPPITPTVDIQNVALVSTGTGYRYSSGIPHYSTGTTFTITGNLSDFSQYVYRESNILTAQLKNGSRPLLSYAAGLDAGEGNIPLIPSYNHPTVAYTVTHTIPPATAIADSGQMAVTARSTTDQATVYHPRSIMVLTTTTSNPTGRVVEDLLPITQLGEIAASGKLYGYRVPYRLGDNAILSPTAWDEMQQLTGSQWDHEAVIAGGRLQWDMTDYANTMPVGPNYNVPGRNQTQYAAFMIERQYVSRMKINIVGTYEDIFIHLPTDVPNTRKYSMRKWGPVAGPPVDGVAYSKLITFDPTTGLNNPMAPARSGSYVATFGSLSTSHTFRQSVVLIVALTAGQVVTHLSVSGETVPDIGV